MADGRTELEKAAWGWHWESLRQSYFTNLGNLRRAEECHQLADRWQQRRDALWAEAQGGEANG
jgi:hypothetical protein